MKGWFLPFLIAVLVIFQIFNESIDLRYYTKSIKAFDDANNQQQGVVAIRTATATSSIQNNVTIEIVTVHVIDDHVANFTSHLLDNSSKDGSKDMILNVRDGPDYDHHDQNININNSQSFSSNNSNSFIPKRDELSFEPEKQNPHTTNYDNTSSFPSKMQSHDGKYYSVARYDRSGSVILDMLRAHAYAFSQNQTYGGACVCCAKKGRAKQQMPNVQALLQELGLKEVLPYRCPLNITTQVSSAHRAKTVNTSESYFNPRWKQYLLGQWNHPMLIKQRRQSSTSINTTTITPNRNKTTKIVAVHIRRGDVNPCRYPDRYRPNSHYLRLIDEYITAATSPSDHHQVYIFSESQSFESFIEFQERNFTLKLDTPLPDALQTMMVADYLITSRSSFSYVPAILNLNSGSHIIHTPSTGLPPLEGWIVPTKEFLVQSGEELTLIRNRCWSDTWKRRK